MRTFRNVIVVSMAAVVAGMLFSGCAMTSYKQGRPEIYTLDEVRRVAVLPFADRDFTDLVIAALVNSSRWDVYDRRDLSQVLQEQDLQQTPRFDRDRAIELGRLAGVQVVIFGEHDYPRVRMQAVSVATGKYLVFRNIDVSTYAVKDLRGQAAYAMQALLPYWIRYKRGVPVDARYGPLADCLKDPALMHTLQDALQSIRLNADADAVECLSELLAAETGNPHVLNLLAWVLATSADEAIRDGERAVALAEQSVASATESLHEFTDTLAAAQAEAGNFEQAVAAQIRALELLGTRSDAERQSMQRRLELYQSGKPMRR